MFFKGQLVKFKENLGADLIRTLEGYAKQGEVYKVFHVSSHADEGGDILWIGPHDASEKDISGFSPSAHRGPRYRGKVFPVASIHLRPTQD